MNDPAQQADGDRYVHDPRALRALAHPTRVAILDYLHTHGPATATQCAAVVHQSPSDCSFHLRTLARWGFVVPAPGKGRQRPWRPVARQLRGPLDLVRSPEGAAAVDMLLREYLRLDEHLLEEYLAHREEFSPAWREAVALARGVVYVTPRELTELTERYLALITEYTGRPRGPREVDLRRVHLVFRTIPSLEAET